MHLLYSLVSLGTIVMSICLYDGIIFKKDVNRATLGSVIALTLASLAISESILTLSKKKSDKE